MVIKLKVVTGGSDHENTVDMIESSLELNPKVTQLSRQPSHMVGVQYEWDTMRRKGCREVMALPCPQPAGLP